MQVLQSLLISSTAQTATYNVKCLEELFTLRILKNVNMLLIGSHLLKVNNKRNPPIIYKIRDWKVNWTIRIQILVRLFVFYSQQRIILPNLKHGSWIKPSTLWGNVCKLLISHASYMLNWMAFYRGWRRKLKILNTEGKLSFLQELLLWN